jgi:hypothetical protein
MIATGCPNDGSVNIGPLQVASAPRVSEATGDGGLSFTTKSPQSACLAA